MVDEGLAILRPVVGVDGLAGLFVGQEDVLVLVDDVDLRRRHGEVGVFGLGRVEKLVVDIELQGVALDEAGVPLGALAVQFNALEADIFLQKGGRQQGNSLSYKPV